jgi:hypothetical protein
MTDIQKAYFVNGKKFLWDGKAYESEEEARATEEDYRENGFEVQRLSAGTAVLLYTRRSVSTDGA